MKTLPKIVVITPIKNEGWILERFLAVTSQFADHIIIADQQSTDDSREICCRYPKVTLIQNPATEYNEADRQILLIKAARELVPGPRILLALDADEILAANAMETVGWQTMLRAEPGTVLCFEKPDLFQTPNKAIRYDIPWPLGYVDNGEQHQARVIHSIRIPMPLNAPRLYCYDIKILHYGMIRPRIQASKDRLYSVQENVMGVGRSVFGRRIRYSSKRDPRIAGSLEQSPKEWFARWEDAGIDMKTIQTHKYYRNDLEVLQYFHQYGVQRFWQEDIWDFDWEQCRQFAKKHTNIEIADTPIKNPPLIISAGTATATKIYQYIKGLLTFFRSSTEAPQWL